MSPNRSRFLDAVRITTPVLAAPEVRSRWEEPSALAGMSVGSLAGHLVRAITSVEAYLRRPPPDDTPLLDAAGYYLSIEGIDGDLDSPLHVAIRARAAAEAEDGHDALLRRWHGALDELGPLFAGLEPGRPVAALDGRALDLESYLVTRLVEVVAHCDDLAVSVGLPSPDFGREVTGAVVECLVEVARRRHGDLAVVRAMIRTERDAVGALRVL